ncbi:MAG: hypothetical protein IPO37_20100 [Saprospiraceae bacterium]|jgi:hypothetical protein|nr:hypothetical protein [Saprospiraceae bacterium]
MKALELSSLEKHQGGRKDRNCALAGAAITLFAFIPGTQGAAAGGLLGAIYYGCFS